MTAAPTSPPALRTWAVLEPSATLAGDPAAMIWTGERFIAAVTPPTVLASSVDGQSWGDPVSLGKRAFVWALAAGPGGIVAVGNVGERAAAWHSSDGRSWQPAPASAALSASDGRSLRMNDVIATDRGWLAVGSEEQACFFSCDLASPQAVVWASADGLAWTRLRAEASRRGAGMESVVATADGFVAVGTGPSATGSAPVRPVVWLSDVGETWERLSDADALQQIPEGADRTFGVVRVDAAVSAGRIVMVGTVGTQGDVSSTVAWWSDDGRSWRTAKFDRFLYGQLFAVSSAPGGFVAVGPSGRLSCAAGIWTTADGKAWECVNRASAFRSFAPQAVAASPTTVVVLANGGAIARGSE